MASNPLPEPHAWWRPEDVAAYLHATPHGKSWRGPCPAHGGDNPESLSIRYHKDKYGNPCTWLHCFAQDCDIRDICDGLGIALRNLFAIHPDYAKATRSAPRACSPRIDRLKVMEEPTPDEIAQIMLEEMIVSDPQWIQGCAPARQKMWELATGSPKAKEAFTKVLYLAQRSPGAFWQALATAREG